MKTKLNRMVAVARGQILTIAVLLAMTGVSRSAIVYKIDNGFTGGGAIGTGLNHGLGWMNSFQVVPGGEKLTTIGIVTYRRAGSTFIFNPFTLYLWTDPTNDGDPSDAVVARTIPAGGNSEDFKYFPFEPLTLPVGSWFYAGAISSEPHNIIPGQSTAFIGPALFADGPSIPNRSFLATWLPGTVNPNNLASGNLRPSGVWPIRVNVPEPGSVSLIVVAVTLCCSTLRMRDK